MNERPNMLLGQFKCGIEEDRHCGNKTVQPMYPIKVTEWLRSLCAVMQIWFSFTAKLFKCQGNFLENKKILNKLSCKWLD